MDADRALCQFGDGCAKNLRKVIRWFGFKGLYIRDSHDVVMKITDQGGVAKKIGTMAQTKWEEFKRDNGM